MKWDKNSREECYEPAPFLGSVRRSSQGSATEGRPHTQAWAARNNGLAPGTPQRRGETQGAYGRSGSGDVVVGLGNVPLGGSRGGVLNTQAAPSSSARAGELCWITTGRCEGALGLAYDVLTST